MKASSIVSFFACALMATNLFADAANVLITFSTPGPDTYQDGTTVKDGEYYALVWTAGEAFAGFTTAGEAVDPAQKVIYKSSLAKGGRCPFVCYQIDSTVAPEGGVYAVYLLDTRGSTKDQMIVTGSVAAKTYASSTTTSKIATVTTDATKATDGSDVALKATTAGLVDVNGLAAPKITDFKLVGSEVKITVANILPGLAYEVKGGLDKQGDVTSTVVDKGDSTIEMTVDKDAAQFFSIKVK